MRDAACARVRAVSVAALLVSCVCRLAHADAGDSEDDLIDPSTGDYVEVHVEPRPGEVIEVHGEAPKAPEQATLHAEELHVLPGGGNDALRSLTSLPGVARIPFGLGGLALRGAAPHDTRVYLDDIPVPILYHFGGFASFVPIDAVDRVDMLASGAGPEWGGGIGGVVTLASRSAHPTVWSADGEISLLHAGVLATGPAADHGSWMIGMRRSYVDAVLAAAQVDMALAPSYLDGQLRWESGDRKWSAIAFASSDDLHMIHDPNSNVSVGGVENQGVTAFDYMSRFARAGLRYNHDGVTVTPWVGLNDLRATATQDMLDKGYQRSDTLYGMRVDIAKPAFGGVLRYGGEATATYYDYTITGVPPAWPGMAPSNHIVSREGQRMATDAGLYLEQRWVLGDGALEIRPGLRFDYFDLDGTPSLDPRLSVVEHTHGATITESVGMYHESPLITDLDPIFMRDSLAAPQSTQATVAAETGFFGLFEARATAYYQQQDSLPVDVITGATPISANGSEQAGGLFGIARELVDAQFGSYSYREDVGKGYAYGLELMARREVGAFTGWIAYTYSRAYRTRDPRIDPVEYPWVLDQPNVLTLVGTRPISAHWRLGGRLRLASGNPITPVAGSYYDAAAHKYVALDGAIMSERLPAFAQLDVRLDRAWRHWDLYIDIQNITNNENVEGVDYSTDYTQRTYTAGLPILPSIGLIYRSQ